MVDWEPVKIKKEKEKENRHPSNANNRMSTPPVPTLRKVKLVNSLKAVQSEQASKLQNKFQLESDLLEDIKTYAKLRATAEHQYSQALSRITSQLLGKFNNKEETKEQDSRTPYGLWRKILEDTEIMANSRLKVSQTLTSDICESIKTLKNERVTTIKKCSSLNEKLHEELSNSATEMVKSQKTYTELQKQTLKEIDAVTDAQEKIRKGTVGLFSSKGRLEKTLTKANERRGVAEKRSTMARNDYLLYISAMNAHQTKYYALDLPDLIAVQDENIYENFKEYYSIITNTEKEVCENVIKNLQNLQKDIQELERAHAIQYFLKENPVFTKCTPYEMMPCLGDEINKISHEFEAGLALNKEARKWCNRMVQKQKMIRKKNKQLIKLKQAGSTDNNLNQIVETPPTEKAEKGEKGEKPKTRQEQIEALIEEIRHLEIIRTKAEGRIEALKHAGIDTDNWLQGALTEIGETDDENDDGASENPNSQDYNYGDEDDDNDFDDWDDPPNEQLSVTGYSDDALSITSTDVTRAGTPAVVIYPFEASAPEELSLQDGEEVDFLENHGDGWCKARNKSGQVGFVPETYIEIKPKAAGGGAGGGVVDNEAHSIKSTTSSPANSFVSDAWQVSLLPCEPSPAAVQPPTPVEVEPTPAYVCYAKAVYDYEACEDEELSFSEGDIIMVTSCQVDDDDGWWEGVLNGKKGVFPSIVVEETTPPADRPVPRQRAQTDQFNYGRSGVGSVADAGRTYSMINER